MGTLTRKAGFVARFLPSPAESKRNIPRLEEVLHSAAASPHSPGQRTKVDTAAASEEAIPSGLKEEEVSSELDLEIAKIIKYGEAYFQGAPLLAGRAFITDRPSCHEQSGELNRCPKHVFEGTGEPPRQPGRGRQAPPGHGAGTEPSGRAEAPSGCQGDHRWYSLPPEQSGHEERLCSEPPPIEWLTVGET